MAGLSTKDLVGSPKVSADRVKKLESGDLDRVQLATLPRHAEAIGGRLEIESRPGDGTSITLRWAPIKGENPE